MIEGLEGNELLSGCRFDGGMDAGVGTTAADITVHSSGYVFIAGPGIVAEEGGSAHDLPSLAVPALGHVVFEPSLLHGVVTLFR